jgi:hypothetical protein
MGFISQKTPFFIVTAVKSSTLAVEILHTPPPNAWSRDAVNKATTMLLRLLAY